jgi:hypothetical protein
MKIVLLLSLMLASLAYAEEDCPPAAEAAATQNPNAYKDCDYSNTGLNGMLHRSWKKKKEESEEQESVAAGATKGALAETTAEVTQTKNLLAKGVFSSAQQLQTLRFTLIQNSALECPKGFLLESEKYLPQPDKTTKLELQYHCL